MRRARESRGPVLELFSGAGELARSLAEAGLEVVGVEPHAPERIAQLASPRRLELMDADPRALRLKKRFALVLAVGSALRRPGSTGELDALFATAAAHLSKDGVFLLETARHGRGRERERASVDPRIGITRGVRSDPRARQPVHLPHLAQRGWRTAALTRLSLLTLPAPELLRRLDDAGLQAAELYGDFDERPFDPDSPRLICVAHPRR